VLALLVGCRGGDADSAVPVVVVEDLEAVVAERMGTVVTVTWRTDVEVVGAVEFGLGGVPDRRTSAEAEPGLEHSAVLVGLPADSEVTYRPVHDGHPGASATVTTGALAPAADLSVEGTGHDRFLALPLIEGDTTTLVLVDPEGRVVWQYEDPSELAVFRAHLAGDGSGLVYAATLQDARPHEGSHLVRVSWDLATVEELPVPLLAHDFVELPDGTLVSLAYDIRDEVEGNRLVAVAADGTTTEVWSTWDCFDPVVNPSVDGGPTWTHANALDYDADADVFHVGLRNLGTIVEVDRATGACNWAFGGTGGSVEIDGQAFLHQHQFTRLEGGLLVFDNDGAPGLESQVLEYDFDVSAMTATQVRAIRADPPLHSFVLGDAHRLADGDTIITWSVPATLDRVDADDRRTWRLAGEDMIFGFSEVVVEPARPGAGVSH